MHVVEITEKTRVAGLCLLPGSRIEFANCGQANSFVYRNGGKYDKPKPPKRKKRSDTVDADQDSGASREGGNA